MRLYPLFADLRNRAVLVVGGGKVAERKVTALLAADALITVGSPTLTPRLRAWAADGKLTHKQGRFDASWLEGQWLVIAATDDSTLNWSIADSATVRRLWVNVVDDRVLSTFHVPAVVDRHPLMVAISTGGSAPALAGLVRAHLESVLDHSLGALVELSERFRTRIRLQFPAVGARRRFYAWIWHGPVARLLRAHKSGLSKGTLETALSAASPAGLGSVALVGAGPGAPELLTLGGLRRLQEADVILHDRLVSGQILDLARRDAEVIDVGKTAGSQRTDQDAIHALMETHASQGRRVVRLKGGDPFIFGRGGEELEFLRSRGIPYEVVPGITSVIACAAYAGVPLTHRAFAHGVHLITAHGSESEMLDWPALGSSKQTLAVYMGVAQIGVVRARLMANGRSGTTPIAIIENGTLPEQRVILGNLAELEVLARKHAIESPAMLIVGEVAALASELGWFSSPNVDHHGFLTHAA